MVTGSPLPHSFLYLMSWVSGAYTRLASCCPGLGLGSPPHWIGVLNKVRQVASQLALMAFCLTSGL